MIKYKIVQNHCNGIEMEYKKATNLFFKIIIGQLVGFFFDNVLLFKKDKKDKFVFSV